MGFQWLKKPTEVWRRGIEQRERAEHAALVALCKNYTVQIEAWMKLNAPWIDRTGNLRQSLYAEVHELGKKVWITMDYGLDYGYWIAVANAGRYDIIGPAIDHWGPILWNAVKELVKGQRR